jgi:cytoskeletal protein CcmA (bactofilin family)
LQASLLLPASLDSNNTAPAAVQIGGSSLISGDVRSGGGVTLSSSCRVLGSVETAMQPITIPDMWSQVANTYSSLPGLAPSGPLPDSTLSGGLHYEGPLSVQGNLTLDNAVVVIDGDLGVTGSVSGSGALIVGGSTTVQGGASLQSTNQVVLLSQGDIQLSGGGKHTSSFQGLMYTNGQLTANNITLMGIFMANGVSSSMTLHDVDIEQVPVYGQATFNSTPANASTFTLPFHVSDLHPAIAYFGGYTANDVATLLAPAQQQGGVAVQPPQQWFVPAQRSASGAFRFMDPRTGSWSSWLPDEPAADAYLEGTLIPSLTGLSQIHPQCALIGSDLGVTLRSANPSSTPGMISVPAQPGTSISFTFDLNKFIDVSERMRILVWKRL